MSRTKNLNEADATALLSWAIQLSALYAKALQADGHDTGAIYDSLKWMQLLADRKTHAQVKAGKPPTLTAILPPVPELDSLPSLPVRKERKTRLKRV
jgi:hypothetical protein